MFWKNSKCASIAGITLGLYLAGSQFGCSSTAPAEDTGNQTPDGGTTGICTVSPAVFDGDWTVGTSGQTTYHRFDTPAAKGLIIELHGTNGTSLSVATKKKEWQSFHAAATALGYSLLVPESEERDKPRRWDNSPSPNNVDVVRIVGLLNEATQSGKLDPKAPIYLIGMSQGAGVAPIFGQLLKDLGFPVRAVASYCGGTSPVFSRDEYTLPTTFAAMAEDDVITDSASAASANVAALTARGIDTALFIKPAENLCDNRFVRIPGIDENASRELYNGLRDAGVTDVDGRILSHGSDLQGAPPPGIPAELSPYADDIDEQLQVVAAGHAFFGDRNSETLDFFEAHP